jgi:hypothetical protein
MEEFSDETPTSTIIRYWKIEFYNRPLNKILFDLAIKYTKEYFNLQPTYAQHSAVYLNRKFHYSIDRLLSLYDMNKEQVKECKDYILKLADALKLIEKAKHNHYLRNYSLKEEI